MITMEEVNQAITDAWTQDLKKQESLPVKVARGYKQWVRGQIKAAAKLLQEQDAAAAESGGEQQQGGEQAQ